MAEEYITKPWLNLDKDGHADILFVLPYEQRQFDENVLSNGDGKELREAIEGTFSSFAVVTLKKTSGAWPDKNIESKVLAREGWLKKKVARYTPNVVVFMGVNMARYIIPEIKDKDAFDLVASFQRWKLDRNTEQLCFVYTQLAALYRDYEMRSRIGENFAKLYAASKGRNYHLVGKYEDLDYRHAKDFLKYCINDVKGYIAFDTETYSLNQVHNTRLGAMQFSLNTSESQIMLWDSDKCLYSRSEKEKLRKLLLELFSSKDTNLEGWIMHNAPFDMNQMRAEFGVRIPYEKIVRDTWIRMHLMDENRINRGEKFNLKQLSYEMFGFTDYDREALEARSNGVIMDLPRKKFLKYAGNDPVCTFRLDKVIEIWAKIEGYYDSLTQMTNVLHNPALRLYSEMKVNGFAIDMQRLAELLAPNSVIKKRLFEIQQAYRTYPEIQKVNEDMYKRNAGKTKLFRVPWIFDMNKPSFRNELFFHNKNGFQYPPNTEDKKTGKPKYSSGKIFQEAYSATNPIVALFHEAQGLSQMKKMYIQPIYEALSQGKHGDVSDMRVHPNFNMAGTVTGRLSSNNPNCFASGTPVLIPCNYSKNPTQSKPIEKLKVGEYVYCLDDQGKLAVRKVLHKWNQGKQEVIRIHFKAGNGKSKTYFDVTEDHKIRTLGFKWRKAGKLKVGDRVMALSLCQDGNYYLTNHIDKGITHRAIAESLYGVNKIRGKDVHHKDGCHANNCVANLEVLSEKAHWRAHKKLNDKAAKFEFWRNASRYTLLRLFAKCCGRIARCRSYGTDFTTFKRNLIDAGIDYKNAAKRYAPDGTYLTRRYIRKLLRKSQNTEIAARRLNIGTRLLKTLASYYGIPYGVKSKKAYQPDMPVEQQHISQWPRSKRVEYAKRMKRGANNHVVTKIERLGVKTTVWDIEVEEFHNFFASEVNVCNCQQIPRSDTPTKKAIKALFVAPKGRALMQADFAAAEVRMWGAMSKDRNLCELLQESFKKRGQYRKHPDSEELKNAAELMGDVHKQTASLMFGVDLYGVDWKDKQYKDMRQTTKSITFGLMYGRGTQSVSAQINKTVEETDELKAKFFKRFSEGEAWLENRKKFARSHGYVETPLGRRRRFPQVFSGDKQLIKQAERWAVNAPIQATASDYAALATALLQKYFIENDLTDKYKIVNAVHDSVVIEFPANATDMEFLAKLIRRIYTKDVKKVLADGFGFELMAPMDIDLEVSYNKYRKCKACGATHMMSDDVCDNKVDTGKKDKDGKPIFGKCGGKKFSEEKLRYHAYGYLTELVETPEGFANAALGL